MAIGVLATAGVIAVTWCAGRRSEERSTRQADLKPQRRFFGSGTLDYVTGKSNVCQVHGTVMSEDIVPVDGYGLRSKPRYNKDNVRRYPHARRWSKAVRRTGVYVCTHLRLFRVLEASGRQRARSLMGDRPAPDAAFRVRQTYRGGLLVPVHNQ
jgi:hypothetical protein